MAKDASIRIAEFALGILNLPVKDTRFYHVIFEIKQRCQARYSKIGSTFYICGMFGHDISLAGMDVRRGGEYCAHGAGDSVVRERQTVHGIGACRQE
jgi:hypothetical protein